MTTLTIKKSNTEELLKIIQSQNEYIIQLLEENNQLIKNQNKPKNGLDRWEIVRTKLLPEFREGNNHNALMMLLRFITKWSKDDKAKVREMLVNKDIGSKHLKTFDKMIQR